ncbi:MAG: isoprenylcysteine carboxylmethyltransferase family protein [Ginsengibacter sp.]
MNLKIGSLIAFGLAVAGALFLVVKDYVFSKNILAIVIQLLSLGLMIWARMTLGLRSFHPTANTTKGELITSGPFRWFRHPIYASLIFFFIASLISFPYLETLIAVLLIIIGLFIRMLLEEKSLKETYKERYETYSRQTKRIIPFIF